jgi:hypothetical protein
MRWPLSRAIAISNNSRRRLCWFYFSGCSGAEVIESRRTLSGLSLLLAPLIILLIHPPAAAFDTLWHTVATEKAADQFGFSPDAISVLKLGNFAPDLFGPVEDYAAQHLDPAGRAALHTFGIKNAHSREAAVFLHFDNLEGEMISNQNFDNIFTTLLRNTRQALDDYDSRANLNQTTRATLILETVGASLHTVQDFYSHSDWIHQDFSKIAPPTASSDDGSLRAPTWFEAREHLGDPGGWPFVVQSGIYPPIAGVLDTHTHMNHDNSRLVYREEENPRQPLLSQAQYHSKGMLPAKPGDASSISRHQQLAVATATAASIEWIRMVEQDPTAKQAIDSVKSWRIRDPKLGRELAAGLTMEKTLSCAAGRWDGEDLPASEGTLCRALNERASPLISGAGASSDEPNWKEQLENLAGGLAATVALPSALKYTGEFWDVHSKYRILDRLAGGFAGRGGRYNFATQ